MRQLFITLLFCIYGLGANGTPYPSPSASSCRKLFGQLSHPKTINLELHNKSLSIETLNALLEHYITRLTDYTIDFINLPWVQKMQLDHAKRTSVETDSTEFVSTSLFPIAGNSRLQFKPKKKATQNDSETPESLLHRRFPFLTSSPTEIPGKNAIEQRVHLAHQILMQTLFFYFRGYEKSSQGSTKSPSNLILDIDPTHQNILKNVFDSRLMEKEFIFLEEAEFNQRAKNANLPEHRFMIAEKNGDQGIIYVNLKQLQLDRASTIDQVNYLVGLLAHEFAHLKGYTDNSNRTLDQLALSVTRSVQNNFQAKEITLPNNRIVSLYLFRLADLNLKIEPTDSLSIPMAGSRIILNDGTQLHDLTSPSHMMMLSPWTKDNIVAAMNYWGLKSLNPIVEVTSSSSEITMVITLNTQVELLKRLKISNGRSNKEVQFEIPEPQKKSETHEYMLRFEIVFDKVDLKSVPKSIYAIDGTPKAVNAKEEEIKAYGESVFGKNLSPIDIGVKMEAQFGEHIVKAGDSLELSFIFKVPANNQKLLHDLQTQSIYFVPVLTNKDGPLTAHRGFSGVVPSGISYDPQIKYDGSQNYLIKATYKYTIENQSPSERYLVDKVIIRRGEGTEGYFMLSKASSPIYLMNSSNNPQPNIKFHSLANSNGTLQINSPFKINDIVMNGVIEYENYFGHRWSQPIIVPLYQNGQIINVNEGYRVVKISDQDHNLILQLSATPNYNPQVENITSIHFHNIRALFGGHQDLTIPIELEVFKSPRIPRD